MTDEERKAWGQLVHDIQHPKDPHLTDGADYYAVLAADAELARLRDAVLWASTLKPLNDYELEYEWSISDELLQRSNMSHLKPSRRDEGGGRAGV